jgi:hypothetical protein
MEEITNRVLHLTRTICRLHRQRLCLSAVANNLKNEGFQNVSFKFVAAICDKLSNEADKYIVSAYENAKNSIFYATEIKNIIREFNLWSERYFFSYKSIENPHCIEFLDMFNDKSM